MPTPHIEAKSGEIASRIILPGDPLRAKAIAEKFLSNAVQFNSVRNMLGFTGEYEGVPVSVMGTGMGMPSIAIYAKELIEEYSVDTLIRVGTCGAYQRDIEIGDVIVASGACTDSNFACQNGIPGTFSAIPEFLLTTAVVDAVCADSNDEKQVFVGNILSTDAFYQEDSSAWQKWAKMGVLGVDMESYALYAIASRANARACSLCVASDQIVTGRKATARQRQNDFLYAAKGALDAAICA